MEVERLEGELSLSEEEPCRGSASMEAGSSAGGTLHRQPGKSAVNSVCAARTDGDVGMVAGGGPSSSEKAPGQRAALPVEPNPAALVRDHAPVDVGLWGFLVSLKELVQRFELGSSKRDNPVVAWVAPGKGERAGGSWVRGCPRLQQRLLPWRIIQRWVRLRRARQQQGTMLRRVVRRLKNKMLSDWLIRQNAKSMSALRALWGLT